MDLKKNDVPVRLKTCVLVIYSLVNTKTLVWQDLALNIIAIQAFEIVKKNLKIKHVDICVLYTSSKFTICFQS